ncbi:MAG: hypothetical protein V4577_06655 [Bacteroidota bacterium]
MPGFKKIKFFAGVFFQFLLIVAVFIVGYGMSFTSVDLSRSSVITGKVISVKIRQSKDSKALPGRNDLIIYLDGQNNGFWIYRASQNYSDLSSALIIGQPLKLYYQAGVGSNDYFTTYQLETGNGIIYSKDEYERKEKMTGRFIALPGAFLLLIVLIFDTKKRYRAAWL